MADDIIDAEFRTIRRDDDRKTAARPAPSPSSAPADAPGDQIGILKSAGQPRSLPGPRMHVAYGLSVLFASIAAFLISGGHVLLRGLPAQASAALELVAEPVTADIARNNIVTVSATVRNPGRETQRVPDVLLTFPAADGSRNLVYRVARGETLPPGKSLAFTVRMPKKPGYAQAPDLRFDANGV